MTRTMTSALQASAQGRLSGLIATLWRYGFSIAGPVATSGAHFLASLLFVRNLPASEFGLFAFVLVIVPFSMSIIAALLVLPVNTALGQPEAARNHIEATCLKMNLILTALAAAIVYGLLIVAHAPQMPALLLALFGGALTYRWFARSLAFVKGRAQAAIGSDLAYAGALLTGLGALVISRHVELLPAACVLPLAALVGLLPFGWDFFRSQSLE